VCVTKFENQNLLNAFEEDSSGTAFLPFHPAILKPCFHLYVTKKKNTNILN
jgi:hypothetical protein